MNNLNIHATFAFITNDQNKVLLIRRAKHDSFPGRWELPGGGVDGQEDTVAAIEREVFEETGLHVKAVKPLALISHKNSKGREISRITYECILLDPDEEVILSRDHDTYEWVDSAQLLQADRKSPLYSVVKGILKTNGHAFYKLKTLPNDN